MSTDPFDVVRRYYRAINSGDINGVMTLYHPECVAEHVFFGSPVEEVRRGRDAVRAALAGFFAACEGAFDDGSHFHVRTIGGIETGWGWAQALWSERERLRESARVVRLSGYSHFFVEDGLIRRHRSVAQEVADVSEAEPDETLPKRTYPPRPVVGVGAVVLVPAHDVERFGFAGMAPEPVGVVLIKRRFEPLAGQWSLPGGTLEVGETLESGVAREIAEETGLAVDVGPVVEVFDRILLDEERRVRYHFVLIDYACRPVGGRLQAGSDVSDVTIADPAALFVYGMTPKANAVIAKTVAQTFKPSSGQP